MRQTSQTLKMLPPLLFPLLTAIFVAGCGVTVRNFGLATDPSMLSIAAGASAVIDVTATSVNGFNGPVSVTVSGLPHGVTASPSTLTLRPGAPQSFTVTATGAAAAGSATLSLVGVSGPLSDTLNVALAVTVPPSSPLPPPLPPPPSPPVPAPDFTLTVAPTSQTATSGGAGAQVTLLAAPVNGFAGTVAVAVTGLPTGVTATPVSLSLKPGLAQSLSLVAGAGALAGTSNVTFTGTSGSLTHAATLALTVQAAATVPAAAGPDVTTYHYDNARDGLNARETTLTPGNVNSTSFGLLGVYPVDGKVDAQPLYVGGLTLPTGTVPGTVNVLYVATEHDSVYALNAATGAQEWKSSILGANETPSDPRGCGQITPEIGITATPVIDRAYGKNGAIFVVGMTKDASGGYHQRLHALDLTTGAELPGSPTEIAATYPGSGANSQNGTNTFDPAQYAERAGLLLLNGTIYMGWTSHCDIAPYTGWVMGYSESTLKQSAVLNLTPNGSDGSIWMSGFGLAADSGNNIYLLDANGTLDGSFTASGFPSRNDYGNAMLKLSTGGSLAVSDFFEPYNTVQESSADQDLGSGGAMLLPDLTDSAGAVHRLVVGAGKDGSIYVGNRDNLGKFNQSGMNNNNLYQEIPNALPNGAWSGPAYFNNTVYYAGVGDVLRAYTISNAVLSNAPTSQSATSFAYPGSTPSVSANGTQDGIVWAVESATGAAGVLHAYDAANVGHELYNSSQAPNGRDSFGTDNKFITPVVANGDVFVGTTNGVAVFGLLKP